MARSSASGPDGKAWQRVFTEGRRLSLARTPGGVSAPGSSATAHRPSPTNPLESRREVAPHQASNRKVVNRCAVPPAVGIDGTGYVARCRLHPKYRGLRRPRVACQPCWAIFFGLSESCFNCGCQHIEDQP